MFNVGDYIIIKRGAPYTFTTYKSTGVVTSVNGGVLSVEFDYISGGYHGQNSFDVQPEHCKLVKTIPQQERICNKIKLMESRWTDFQARKLLKEGEYYV